MIQNTVDPAEARMKSGRLIKKTSPYCSTRLNSRPTKSKAKSSLKMQQSPRKLF